MDDEVGDITALSFTDRQLDTLILRDGETASVNEFGVMVRRPRFNNKPTVSLYPWTSIFSVTYA